MSTVAEGGGLRPAQPGLAAINGLQGPIGRPTLNRRLGRMNPGASSRWAWATRWKRTTNPGIAARVQRRLSHLFESRSARAGLFLRQRAYEHGKLARETGRDGWRIALLHSERHAA